MTRKLSPWCAWVLCGVACGSGLLGQTGTSPAITNQRVSKTGQPLSGCVVPPAATSFSTTDNAVYLFFNGTVRVSDNLSNDWLAPTGDVVPGGNWNPAAGSFCFTAAPLAINNLPAARIGAWQARVFDNGTLLFAVPFTVTAGADFPKSIAEPSGTPFLTINPALGCPGYYTAVIGLYPGAKDGIWGTEIQLSAGQRYLQGGVNLGGGFAANGGSPGFAAFNIANPANEPQSVTINVNAQALGGVTNAALGLTLQVLDSNRNPVGPPVQKVVTSGAIAVSATQTLVPGFYVLSIQSTSGSVAGTFQLALTTQFTNRAGGAFQGGVVVGGYLVSGPNGAAPGFAGFCISEAQNTSIAAYSSYLYGAAGAGAVTLQVNDVAGKQFWIPSLQSSAARPENLLRATEILNLRQSQ